VGEKAKIILSGKVKVVLIRVAVVVVVPGNLEIGDAAIHAPRVRSLAVEGSLLAN